MDNIEREIAIKESDRFQALFQYASMGILVANGKGVIVMVNNFLLKQFGYFDPLELQGKKIETLIPARYHQRHVGHRSEYEINPRPRSMGLGFDLYGLKKDGTEIPVEISLSNFISNDEHFTIAFISDISKRKEIENAVLSQKEQLASINSKIEGLNNELEEKVELRTNQLQQTLQQLQESKDELSKALSKEKELSDLKSRFVSMASHEFRTPLSTILSSASLVAKYTQTDEQAKRDKHIMRIKSSVSNLTDLLNEFLSIGKIEDGKVMAHMVEFNIKELLQSICNELQVIAKPRQKIVLTHAGDTLITLDPSLLRNVLINLLSNAIKFSPEGGFISVASTTKNKSISLCIKDTGMGISAEDQEHLFERFFRGKNATNIQGTGLGLHIVSKYIELMNGQINFESELEKGTEFIVTFKQDKIVKA